MSEATYEHTLGLIYDVAAAPDRWPDLLHRLGEQVRCHFVGMVSSTPDRSEFQGMAVGVDHAEHQSFLRRFHQRNPMRLAGAPRFSGEIIQSQAIVPRAELEHTEMYQAFYRPNDMGEGLRLTIWQGEAGSQTISLLRPWEAGSFDTAELGFARAIMPHLQRMAQMHRHLRAANLLAHSARVALDAVRQAVILLDRGGHLVHANATAEALLRAEDGLGWSNGCLVAATRSATGTLQGMIAAASRKTGISGSMRLPRPSGRPALAAIAMPVRGLDSFTLAGDPAVLLAVADPAERSHDLEPRTLMDLFGLTPAEAALAVRMLAGEEVNAIAASGGRSVHTMRSHLARLMEKTETRRQSELIRLLDRLPRLPRDG